MTVMQLTIISLPPQEQVTSLSFPLNDGETLIGQSEACQIQLPDRHQGVASLHALLTREDDDVYIESLEGHAFTINQHSLNNHPGQRVPLSDGDILAFGDYQLVFSHFTPWRSNSRLEEQLEYEADPLDDLVALPQQAQRLFDPFDEPQESDPVKTNDNVHTLEHSVISGDDSDLAGNALMDSEPVPGDEPIDLMSASDMEGIEWNIHRMLWQESALQPDETDTLFLECEASNEHESSSAALSPSGVLKQPSLAACYATLQALDQTMMALGPRPFKEQNRLSDSPDVGTRHPLRQSLQSLFKENDKPSNEDAFSRYEHYFYQLVEKKHHRRLFIQWCRQIMGRQR